MTIRRVHAIVAVLGLIAAGSAAYVLQRQDAPRATPAGAAEAAQRSQPAAANAALVEAGKVEVMTLHDEAQAVGSLRSRQGVMLRPEVSGRIAKIGFTDGQRVKRGQLLVQLDETLQRAQLQQAEAQASIARTNLKRNRELVAQNFVSQSAVDQSAATLEVAEAQVALARAQLSRMRIEAPFDGVAGIRSVYVGDYVKDGADLVNIEDLSSMVVDFRLPERVLSRIKVGQSVDVTLDAFPARTFDARVDALDSQLDANGRSLLVRARLDNADLSLRPGMFARARIVFATREKALVVPEEALVPLAGKQWLIKLVDSADGKVTERLQAKLGLRVPGKVEVLEGLRAGDVVVTAGQARLLGADGLAVKVVTVGAAASAQ